MSLADPGGPGSFPPPPPFGAPRRRWPVVLVALLVAGILVVTGVATYRFFQTRQAKEEKENRPSLQGTPAEGDQPGSLEEVLEDLFEDALGGVVPAPGAQPDLLACLGGGPGVEPAAPLHGGLAEQVRQLARAVEAIRDLDFEEQVEARFLSSADTARRVQDLFLREYTAAVADRETRFLQALGAVPGGIDLRDARAQALGSEVVGFYVPGTGELVVQAQGGTLKPLDRVILAHELEHALADQNLGFPIPLHLKPGREDRDLAGVSVIEGDATLTMQRYALTLPFQDQLELVVPGQDDLGDLPYYLEQELLFPYEQGLAFDCRLFGEGGWPAVNRAYSDPPTTSAQILFPDRYLEGEEAVDPTDPGSPGGGWRPEGTRELGAANLLWLFEAPGGHESRALDDPRTGAAAWAGGEARLWTRGSDTAVGVALAEQAGEDVLCSAISHWYASAFPTVTARGSALQDGLELDGGAQDAVLVCDDDDVHLGIAPDMATARRLAGTG